MARSPTPARARRPGGRRRPDRLRRGGAAAVLRRRLDRRTCWSRSRPAGRCSRAYRRHAPVADVVARCAEVTTVSPALAAIDLALWDLAGRRAASRSGGCSAAARRRRPQVEVNWTIAAADRSGAAQEAAEARVAGFTTVKLKVGIGDDAGRVAAVRAFGGPHLAIRIDANGAWDRRGRRRPAALARAERDRALRGARPRAAPRSPRCARRPRSRSRSTSRPIWPARSTGAYGELACLKIARCGGIAGTLAAADGPAPPATRSTSPRRSTGRWESPQRSTARP